MKPESDNYFDISNVFLPDLIGGCWLVFQLVCSFDQEESRASD